MNLDPEMTTYLRVPTAIDREACDKHNATRGVPCFDIFTDTKILPGICNGRAKRAGFKSQPTKGSYRR